MKIHSLLLFASIALICGCSSEAGKTPQAGMTTQNNATPQASKTMVKPAHVVFVIEENKAYSNIIGSPKAPTFTALSKASYTANFTRAFAITHPSEPNYLDLFSGSDQGVTSDIKGPAPDAPFHSGNLCSSLIHKGYTFVGYSENQPYMGCITDAPPLYRTKHCPWINWVGQGAGADSVPERSNVPFSMFPDSTQFSSLPTVAWIIPNMTNDMHDGPPDVSIPNGDKWFHDKIMPLERWASDPKNNTIVIVTWDEDDHVHDNNVALLVSGGIVNAGNYDEKVNHYDVLKTVEDMYQLPELGHASSSDGAVDLPAKMWKSMAD